MFGVLYGVLIFVGFETAANLAEETAEPKKSIPRAVLLSVVVVSIFYIIAAYVEVAGFGFDMAVITSPDVAGAPLFALGAPGGEFGSDFILKLLLVVVFLDMLAVYVGAAVASTRGVFAMARDRRLPKMMAGVSAKYGTPTGAIAFLMGVQLGLIAASEWWDEPVRARRAAALLLAVRLVLHVRWLRAAGRVLPDVVGGARGARDGSREGQAGHRGDPRAADQRAAIFGSFYKVPIADDPGSDVRGGVVRGRDRSSLSGEGAGAGERRAGGPQLGRGCLSAAVPSNA